MLYRIFWKNKDGIKGHGEPIDEISARAWIVILRQKHPEMEHWIVPTEEIVTSSHTST